MLIRRLASVLPILVGLVILTGCQGPGAKTPTSIAPTVAHGARWTEGAPRVLGLTLDDLGQPRSQQEPLSIQAARNEWTSFALQVDASQRDPKQSYSLRITPPRRVGGPEIIPADQLRAYQLISLPFDTNRAGYIRHTGRPAERTELPRALLPLSVSDGRFDLRALRDPDQPTTPDSRALGASRPADVWVDLHVPVQTAPGTYIARCEIRDNERGRSVASVDVELTVYDFVLPEERHLLMVGDLSWEDLRRLYPDGFEAVRPQLIRRDDPAYGRSVEVLDRLIALGQANRTEVVASSLQPVVKWLSGRPPQIDWTNLDALLSPWLDGDAFANRSPLGFWPLPGTDQLQAYDPQSRADYWQAAAVHFEQRHWLERAPVVLDKVTPGRASTVESLQLSADAARVLSMHPRVRIILPLEQDQLQLSTQGNEALIDPSFASRLITASPGLVASPALRAWPDDVDQPSSWLRTDLPGEVPHAGAGGSESDVRLWAWLAYLRSDLRDDAQMVTIHWGSPLPQASGPSEPGNPGDVVWFYPGAWFGVDEPVPTVQLKWLRRAQQDFEYLWIARARGEAINALVLSRLMAKPVDLQPGQPADPTYALMSGTPNAQTWDQAQALLARSILLRTPGQADDPDARAQLNLNLLQWTTPRERPVLLGRSTDWILESNTPDHPGKWAHLTLGVDLYNASDRPPSENELRWSNVAPPWQVSPYPLSIPTLEEYRIQHHTIDASVNLEQLSAVAQQPLELTFTDGYQRRDWTLPLSLPVAASDRRRPGLVIDGALDDWTSAEAIQDGPMVRLLSRPMLQEQRLDRADTPTSIYTGWSDDNLYIAFRLEGIDTSRPTSTWNFVNYDMRRAWGEDLAEILIQPVYDDNSLGPVLHVVCKPTGHWVERKGNPRELVNPWQALEGAGLRYYASWPDGVWRGELAIPWDAIVEPGHDRPRLIRFNFTQHQSRTGDSASWAGPIDFGRDNDITGLLYLREDGSGVVAR